MEGQKRPEQERQTEKEKGITIMKPTKIFKAVAFSALLLAETTGAALAQDSLESGEPYPGFF